MKFLTISSIVFFLIIFKVYSAGMTLHMFIAEDAIKLIKYPKLQKLLEKEKDAYLNGAYYPDSGYLKLKMWPKVGLFKEGKYGEFSHWEGFLNPYLRHIRDKCSWPFDNCKTLMAHFLGVVGHTMGDVNFDRYFCTQVWERDFSGDMQKAGEFTDIGTDYLAIMEHNRGPSIPSHFVPIDDLLQIYRKAGKEISREDIEYGTNLSRTFLILERGIAPFAYLYHKFIAPWGVQNYYDGPGGVIDSSHKLALLLEDIWHELTIYKDSNTIPILKSTGGWPNVEFFIDRPL